MKREVHNKFMSRIEKIARTISLVLFGLILVGAGVLVGGILLRFKETASDDVAGDASGASYVAHLPIER